MQNSDDAPTSSSQHRRHGNHLPPLAPRDARSSSRAAKPSTTSATKPPRLSHRSRAGCWTCRGRKVKCDEKHPRCTPCTRLNRECDWDHRWNFSDATETTLSKYSNVTTQGNSVWDPSARSTPCNSPLMRYDDLPAFLNLHNDDERERKAETQLPGTYGVVVTPDSFSDLPEYSSSSPTSRRMSMQSTHSRGAEARRTTSLRSASSDPNTIVLDRFEDASPSSASPFALPSPIRRPSLHDGMYHLAISTPPPVPLPSMTAAVPVVPSTRTYRSAHDLTARFRHHILHKLCEPQPVGPSFDAIVLGSTRDIFELEAQRFVPLHHAICALSSLSLAAGRKGSLETAIQHYSSALSAGTTNDGLISDGVFLRHFLLLVYDICTPPSNDGNMWATHLDQLKRLALARYEALGHEPQGYIIWRICELDTYACLMGHGSCDFVRHVIEHNMLPALEQQIPVVDPANPYQHNESQMFPAILHLRQNVLISTAKMAQLAQSLRKEVASRPAISPGAYARWQAAIVSVQTELSAAWMQAYPSYLPHESSQASRSMAPRVRHVFEQACLLHQAAVIYSRTSMFPHQQRITGANNSENLQSDTERRVQSILAITSSIFESQRLYARHVMFPLFVAGYASQQADTKIQSLRLMAAFENEGIGRNSYQTRALLKVVLEEQRRGYAESGGSEVDWIMLAKERGLGVVNCGL